MLSDSHKFQIVTQLNNNILHIIYHTSKIHHYHLYPIIHQKIVILQTSLHDIQNYVKYI